MVFACCCLVLYFLGLGETYLNQARSALQQDFNGKAVDCVMEAINVLARYASLLINHSILPARMHNPTHIVPIYFLT